MGPAVGPEPMGPRGGDMRRWAAVVGAAGAVGAVLAACNGGGGGGGGGGTSGGATLTVSGASPLTATNFAAVMQGATCAAGPVQAGVAYAAVVASDQTGICGFLQRNQNKANARSIRVAVIRVDPTSTTTTITTGTYPIVPNPTGAEAQLALVLLSSNDATCSSTDDPATSGSVTVTSVSADRVQGTVTATLQSGATVSGNFDAATCAVTFPGDLCSGKIGPQNPTCAQ